VTATPGDLRLAWTGKNLRTKKLTEAHQWLTQ